MKRFKNQTVNKYDRKENSFHINIDVGFAEMTAISVLIVIGEGETLLLYIPTRHQL
jgi:hypothetical protein